MINGLDAYFAADKMFACISGKGVGLRLPVAKATELQFSRDNVVPFQPGGISTERWFGAMPTRVRRRAEARRATAIAPPAARS
jgi:hypothetical protein